MTTVSTPSAAAATAAVDGGPAPALPDDLLVLPEAAPLLVPGPVLQQSTIEVLEALPGDRLRRLQQRRRLVREEILAVLFLFLALAITVGVLAMQWLGAGGPAS